MLELRPTCEHCNKPLPPESSDARICSFECTFCGSCVDRVLGNICPNCGGGFVEGSIRPAKNSKVRNSLDRYPPSGMIKHLSVDPAAHPQIAGVPAGGLAVK